MNILPVVSLVALLLAIVVSCVSRINVGFLSIAFAFIIGVFLGGMRVRDVMAGFPVNLFLTLVGVTLLFSQARVNGTLDRVVALSVRLARGNSGVIPLIFFVLALVIATVGAGNIAATALLAPIAMAVAGKVGITAFLMAIMVANGANAGALSPFAPTGIIANDLMAKIGLTAVEWRNFLNTLMAQSFVALAGYVAFGGLKLLTRGPAPATAPAEDVTEEAAPFTWRQWLTLAMIAGLVGSVVLLKVDVALGAFAGAAVLSLCRAADEEAAVKAIPWGAILMVSGVTVLIALLEKTGGMELFTSFLARISNQTTVTGMTAFVTGAISIYSSTSGVVLPVFLPTIPDLIAKLGGGDPLAIASSMNVGAHLVDLSPFSTLGALCLASAPPAENRLALYNKLLAWGLSMCLVGAVVCFIFFGLLS